MEIIKISEECHGEIAICDSYESALWYIVKNGWITLNSQLRIDDRWQYVYKLTHFPKDTPLTNNVKKRIYKYLKTFDMNDEMWDGNFYFTKEEIWSAVPV